MEELWHSLKNLSELVSGSWMVAGDFNSMVSDFEVFGYAVDRQPCSTFCNCINECNMLDVRFQGLPLLSDMVI